VFCSFIYHGGNVAQVDRLVHTERMTFLGGRWSAQRLIRTLVSIILVSVVGSLCVACGQSADDARPTATGSASPASDYVDGLWAQFHGSFPQIPRPDVAIKRSIDLSEWGATMLPCLKEAGFPDVTLYADGSISHDGITVQEDQYQLALYICQAQYPLKDKYIAPLDEQQLEHLYIYYTETLVPCLASHGYQISTPPSETSFLDSYDRAPWYPYTDIPASSMSQSDWDSLNNACPQSPPS
jgi:hypothetical protein